VLLDIIKSPIYPLMILPASQKDKPARDIEVIGTGPYKFGEWVKDSHLVITRFDDYVADTSAPGRDGYGGRKTVYLDAVRYRFMPEATTRIAALQNGEAQLISSGPQRTQRPRHPAQGSRHPRSLSGARQLYHRQLAEGADRQCADPAGHRRGDQRRRHH
jgi:ABC-type transport system substrate-binding protein